LVRLLFIVLVDADGVDSHPARAVLPTQAKKRGMMILPDLEIATVDLGPKFRRRFDPGV
jgi:hypothetical protein